MRFITNVYDYLAVKGWRTATVDTLPIVPNADRALDAIQVGEATEFVVANGEDGFGFWVAFRGQNARVYDCQNVLLYVARFAGEQGNDIQIEYVAERPGQELGIEVIDRLIRVTLATIAGAPTAARAVTNCDNDNSNLVYTARQLGVVGNDIAVRYVEVVGERATTLVEAVDAGDEGRFINVYPAAQDAAAASVTTTPEDPDMSIVIAAVEGYVGEHGNLIKAKITIVDPVFAEVVTSNQGDDAELQFTARAPGPAGNNIQVEYAAQAGVAPAVASGLTVINNVDDGTGWSNVGGAGTLNIEIDTDAPASYARNGGGNGNYTQLLLGAPIDLSGEAGVAFWGQAHPDPGQSPNPVTDGFKVRVGESDDDYWEATIPPYYFVGGFGGTDDVPALVAIPKEAFRAFGAITDWENIDRFQWFPNTAGGARFRNGTVYSAAAITGGYAVDAEASLIGQTVEVGLATAAGAQEQMGFPYSGDGFVNPGVCLIAKEPGALGLRFTIEVESGPHPALSVVVNGGDITVYVVNGVSTGQECVDAINANGPASALVHAFSPYPDAPMQSFGGNFGNFEGGTDGSVLPLTTADGVKGAIEDDAPSDSLIDVEFADGGDGTGIVHAYSAYALSGGEPLVTVENVGDAEDPLILIEVAGDADVGIVDANTVLAAINGSDAGEIVNAENAPGSDGTGLVVAWDDGPDDDGFFPLTGGEDMGPTATADDVRDHIQGDPVANGWVTVAFAPSEDGTGIVCDDRSWGLFGGGGTNASVVADPGEPNTALVFTAAQAGIEGNSYTVSYNRGGDEEREETTAILDGYEVEVFVAHDADTPQVPASVNINNLGVLIKAAPPYPGPEGQVLMAGFTVWHSGEAETTAAMAGGSQPGGPPGMVAYLDVALQVDTNGDSIATVQDVIDAINLINTNTFVAELASGGNPAAVIACTNVQQSVCCGYLSTGYYPLQGGSYPVQGQINATATDVKEAVEANAQTNAVVTVANAPGSNGSGLIPDEDYWHLSGGVQGGDSTTTAAEVKALVEATPEALALVDVRLPDLDDGGEVEQACSLQLSGGNDTLFTRFFDMD